jgi:adenylate cyclase
VLNGADADMAVETERKFIIANIPSGLTCWQDIKQCYLQAAPQRSVRVRMACDQHGQKSAFITIKGQAQAGRFSRLEFEYPIPPEDAESLMALCDHPPIQKRRYYYAFANRTWELDEFSGANTGLLIAEIELESESDTCTLPPIIRQEVTGDARYFNVNLAYNPYTTW